MNSKLYFDTLQLVESINNYREQQKDEIINHCDELMEDYFTPKGSPENDKGSQ